MAITMAFSINTSQTCSWKQKIILSTMLFVIKKYNYLLFVQLYVLINFRLCVLYCMVHCFLLDRSFITFTGYVVGLIFGTVQTTITSCLKLLTLRPNGLAVNLYNLRQ